MLSADYTAPLETLFCWHGFQYVRVSSKGNTGFTGALNDLVGLEIHTNLTQVRSLLSATCHTHSAPQTDLLPRDADRSPDLRRQRGGQGAAELDLH